MKFKISFIGIHKIDLESFTKDLDQVSFGTDEDSIDVDTYLGKILESHAPLVSRSSIPRPHALWYSEYLRIFKQISDNIIVCIYGYATFVTYGISGTN